MHSWMEWDLIFIMRDAYDWCTSLLLPRVKLSTPRCIMIQKTSRVRAQNVIALSLVVINNTHADKCDLYEQGWSWGRPGANCVEDSLHQVEDNDVGEATTVRARRSVAPQMLCTTFNHYVSYFWSASSWRAFGACTLFYCHRSLDSHKVEQLREDLKKEEKKLTSISFAISHTYTLVKTKNKYFFSYASSSRLYPCQWVSK